MLNNVSPSSSHLLLVKQDLFRLLLVNVVILAVLLGVYVLNKSNGFLENWFFKIVS